MSERSPKDTVQLKLRMSEQLRSRIEKAASRFGRSMNSEILHRFEDYERSRSVADFLHTDPKLQHFVLRLIQNRLNVFDEAESLRSSGTDCNEQDELWSFYLNVRGFAGGRLLQLPRDPEKPTVRLHGRGPNVRESPRETCERISDEINFRPPPSSKRNKVDKVRAIANTEGHLVENGMPPVEASAWIDELTDVGGRKFGLDEAEVKGIVSSARDDEAAFQQKPARKRPAKKGNK